MNDWKYCPHCGKELAADAPIFPQHPQPYPLTFPIKTNTPTATDWTGMMWTGHGVLPR